MTQGGRPVEHDRPTSEGARKIDLADAASLPEDASAGEVLVQDFQADIGRLGETTLTFIDGVFSHAVRRVLRPGGTAVVMLYNAYSFRRLIKVGLPSRLKRPPTSDEVAAL